MHNTTTHWPRALLIPLTILSWLAVSIVTLWLLGHVAITLIMLAFGGVIAFASGIFHGRHAPL